MTDDTHNPSANKTIGRRIQYFRKKAAVSQVDLEASIGGASGFISRIENGQVNPTKETLLKIAAVLKLNSFELDYIDGITAKPATAEEITAAISEVHELFHKADVYAYLLDDRARFIDISESMLKFLGLPEQIRQQYFMANFIKMILDPDSLIARLVYPEDKQHLIYGELLRTYFENSFMFDDETYLETLQFINSVPTYQEMWQEICNSPKSHIHSLQYRKVKFATPQGPVKMIYSVEALQANRRFQIIEYLPDPEI
jgi:transcriptional regulator with XRE-family HTH domain